MNTNEEPPSEEQLERPLALVLSEHIWASTHIQDALRNLDFEVEIVERPADLDAEGEVEPREIALTEPLEGADADFVRALSQRRPALVILDLTTERLPWRRWLHTMKTSSATRRIPVVAFGPHVEKELLDQARKDADVVVSRGELQARLPELVEEHARLVDPGALAEACGGELSAKALRGIDLHNEGEYFEAHEELEHAWMDEEGEYGYLYRALLQVTVAYLHIQRGNYRGATKMLLRVHQWLDPLPSTCKGVDVDRLRESVEGLRKSMAQLGPERLDELDRGLLRPFPMVEPQARRT